MKIFIPVILISTSWQDALFGKLKPLPTNATPIISHQWASQNDAFFDVAKGIFDAIKVSNAKISKEKNTGGFSSGDISYNNSTSSHPKRPLGMQLCPYCIEEFYPSECDICSGRDGLIIERGKTGWLGKRMEPKSLIGSEYRALQACRRCPRCHYLLPYNIEQVDDNISIAIIGDTFSGKSVYLASLIYHMKELWIKNNPSIQMNPLSQGIEAAYHRDYQ